MTLTRGQILAMESGREVNDGGRRARTLLAEIGVTVE